MAPHVTYLGITRNECLDSRPRPFTLAIQEQHTSIGRGVVRRPDLFVLEKRISSSDSSLVTIPAE